MNIKRLLPVVIMTLIVMVGCKSDKYNFDSLAPTVKSFFTITNETLNIEEEINFKNESQDADSYRWDFGDETTSTEQNPTKEYVKAGTYTVKLTAVGAGGTGNYSKDVVIVDPNVIIDTDKELYFIEFNSDLIRKVSLIPGSAVETVVDMDKRAGHGMTYDAVNKKIYYCDLQTTNAGKVLRMDLDGSNIEELLTGLTSPYGVALNLAEGKMYIADGPNVSRANLDGSGYQKEFINVAGGAMRAIGFNSKTGQIYFYEVNVENLYSAKSDGTGAAIIVEEAYGYGMFVDEVNEKIYYDDRNESGLMQANLDGTGVVKVANFSGSRGGSGIAVDYSTNKLYWAETNLGNIRRANLDGTEIEIVLSGVNNPRGMFVK